MFAGGFVEEVARLLDHGLAEGRTAARAIGYREVVAAPAPASSPSRRPASGPRRPPGGSRAGRTRGSARTRASSGSGYDDPQLVDKAVAAVERV